jgi:GT2 family glycosyltransferase
MVTSVLPQSTVLRGEGNWWWGGSLEQGRRWLLSRRHVGDEIVLIMNDDTLFEPDFLGAGRGALEAASRSLLLAQLFSQHSGDFVEAGVHVDWRNLAFTGVRDPAQINCFSTRGLFVRLADFLEIGRFHPLLLPHYASDYEFTIRARRKGFALVTSPAVRLWMNEFTTGNRSIEATSVLAFVKQSLSKRSVVNPLYWSTFVLLACPKRHVLRNLSGIWKSFLGRVWRVARGSAWA